MSRTKDWAHRKGIARTLNSTHGTDGWTDTYVSTAIGGPLGELLAHWAAERPDRPRVAHIRRAAGFQVKRRHVWCCTYERR